MVGPSAPRPHPWFWPSPPLGQGHRPSHSCSFFPNVNHGFNWIVSGGECRALPNSSVTLSCPTHLSWASGKAWTIFFYFFPPKGNHFSVGSLGGLCHLNAHSGTGCPSLLPRLLCSSSLSLTAGTQDQYCSARGQENPKKFPHSAPSCHMWSDVSSSSQR